VNSIKWGISPKSLKKNHAEENQTISTQTEETPTNSSNLKLVWGFFHIESDIRYSVDSNVLLASTVFPIPGQAREGNGKQRKMTHKEKLITTKT